MRIRTVLFAVLFVVAGASCTSNSDGGQAESPPSVASPAVETTSSRPIPPTSKPQTSQIASVTTETVQGLKTDPFLVNLGLSRTLNIGAVYEVAKDETWANDFAPEDLDDIATQGFTAVRIPIRWSDWTGPEPTFSIDLTIFQEIDAVVERALENDLSVIIDVHHFEELDANPDTEAERFLAMWFQIAEHYQDMPPSVVFEVSNEPHDRFSGQVLNDLLAQAVEVIRRSNPDRTIMVGPDQWYSPLRLDTLDLPDDDNLIVTVHYY